MPDTSEMQSPPGPVTVIDGRGYLYFGGTSYLGLAGREEIIEAGCEAARRYGVHSATSRSRVGTNPPVAEVERRAAEFFGVESAFYFGSGYMSNHIMTAALADRADGVAVDVSAHYCVREAARLAAAPIVTFESGDPEDLARAIGESRRPLVMVDGANASTGALAPVEAYIEVLRDYEAPALVVDDAHLFGVLGNRGRGVFEEAGVWRYVNTDEPYLGVRLYACGTLSKALGGFGGIIPGTSAFVARVRNASHYFDGASAPASASAGSSARALEVVLREPELLERLRENTLYTRERLGALGLRVPGGAAAHFGVSIGGASEMARIHESLKLRGVLLPYVGAYAGIPNEGVLRFAVFANHSKSQIDQLIQELKNLL